MGTHTREDVMRLSERIADTIDDTDTALWIADEIWAMEDEIDELRDKLDTIYRKAIATDTRSFKSEQKDFVEYVVRLAEEDSAF